TFGIRSVSLATLPANSAVPVQVATSPQSLALTYLSDAIAGTPTPTPLPTAIATATPVASTKNIYWTNGVDSIQAVDGNGANRRTIATPGGNPVGITFDSASNKLFWASLADGIHRANYDALSAQLVYSATNAREVVVDGANTMLYMRIDDIGS